MKNDSRNSLSGLLTSICHCSFAIVDLPLVICHWPAVRICKEVGTGRDLGSWESEGHAHHQVDVIEGYEDVGPEAHPGRTPSQSPVLVQDDHSQRQSRQHRLHAEKGINSSVIQYRAHQRIGLRDPPVVELNPGKHPIEKGESEDCRRDKPGSKVVDIHVSNPIVSPPARFSAPAEPREQSRFPLATITTCAVFHRIPLSSCHHDTKPYRSLVPRTSDLSGASRSEEHTSELQSRFDLVCRLLL